MDQFYYDIQSKIITRKMLSDMHYNWIKKIFVTNFQKYCYAANYVIGNCIH
jgi:hypothetical protein